MKAFNSIIVFLALTACSHNPKYEIIGSAPAEYEGQTVYFAPIDHRADDPSWRLDSTIVRNGAFHFSGDAEGMAIIRMRPIADNSLQDLLIVTDPGTINVNLDTISTGSGTLQNDALQEWKENLEAWRAIYLPLYQQLQDATANQQTLDPSQSAETAPLTPELQALQAEVDSLLELNRVYNRAFVDRWQSHTIGAFLRHRL